MHVSRTTRLDREQVAMDNRTAFLMSPKRRAHPRRRSGLHGSSPVTTCWTKILDRSFQLPAVTTIELMATVPLVASSSISEIPDGSMTVNAAG